MVEITVTGASELQIRLNKLQKGIKDLQPAFEAMQDGIVQEFVANFPAKGAVLGSPWPDRKSGRGPRGGYTWPLLDKTHKLKYNWTKKAEPQQLTITNPTTYATYHHFGTIYLPVRKLVGSSANIIKIATNYITKYIKLLIS